MVYFDETGKKNVEPQAPQAPAAPANPVFDPFFNTMVDPATGKPVNAQQTASYAPDEGQQQYQQQQAPQQTPWQQQPQQMQQQPQQQQYSQTPPGVRAPQATNHPNGNAYGQQFQLPNQGVNPQMAPAYQQQNQNSGRQPLNLDSAEADLQAFEDNFGDIPL
jgi:hypothetical protein